MGLDIFETHGFEGMLAVTLAVLESISEDVLQRYDYERLMDLFKNLQDQMRIVSSSVLREAAIVWLTLLSASTPNARSEEFVNQSDYVEPTVDRQGPAHAIKKLFGSFSLAIDNDICVYKDMWNYTPV